MPTWLIVTLIVFSGLTHLPMLHLSIYADKKLQRHNPYKWRAVDAFAYLYFLLTCVWMIPVFMATMSPYILGVDYDDMREDYPQLDWMLRPVLPFIGPFMFIAALIIRCFYKPEVQLDTDVAVS